MQTALLRGSYGNIDLLLPPKKGILFSFQLKMTLWPLTSIGENSPFAFFLMFLFSQIC